ncbi:uncharacterized protein LOC132731446 [Ruditapes philippinarum]|uniref:uncharacterized protein LOC132731446 n=1 Tax=Ruditapes philippinarum TaxID=129788 RepID=UPI00295AB17F|nr:uncharacterized protein LOC132731446 [Ruditapes philippinarum]
MAAGQTHSTGDACELLSPPEDWKFVHLLEEFSQKLSDNDLPRIKLIFQGIVTADVTSWIEMFQMLYSKDVINQNNIVYLQKIARHLEREDLHLRTITYAKERENDILHFHQSTMTQGSNVEKVSIHIRGDNFLRNRDLQNVREKFANILMVGINCIKVAGVQEANSVLITFIIPKMYVKVLRGILLSNEANRFTAPFSRQGIDQININGETYLINEIEDQENLISDHTDNRDGDCLKIISELQDQLAQRHKQITKMEEKILALSRSLADSTNIGSQYSDGKDTKKKNQDTDGNSNVYQKPAFDAESGTVIDEDEKKQTKQFKTDVENTESKVESGFSPESNSFLGKHKLPESDQHILLNDYQEKLNVKLVHLSNMSTTFRKLVSRLPNDNTQKIKAMTPEEINAQSLYKKLDRIYPTFLPLKLSKKVRVSTLS